MINVSKDVEKSKPFNSTATLTGTAILSTLVIVFDYALKYSGFKIPFPWMPMLKFDFTGIPVAIGLLLYGLPSAATTSLVAFLAIFARSGDLVGASSKFAAEFATVLGLWVGIKTSSKLGFGLQMGVVPGYIVSLLARVISMTAVNLVVLPVFYKIPYEVAIGMLPLIGVFNAIQGSITVLLGYAIHQAYLKRVRGSLA